MHAVEYEEAGLAASIDFSMPDRAFTVERDGRTVVAPSPVGVSTPGGEFPADYEFVGCETVALDETVRTAHGKRRVHDHRGRAATFSFEADDGRPLAFEVRVTADGAAYRYRVGGDGTLSLFGSRPEFGADDSGFRLPADAVGWLFDYAVDHESVGRHYSAHRAAGEFSTPGLFRAGGDWVLLAEAGVDGDYAASRLATDEASTLFEYRMPRATVNAACPTATPWRVAVVGDLPTVGSSSLVQQLVGAPGPVDGGEDAPAVPGPGGARVDPDADWIEPGRVAWSWWSDTSSPADPAVQREYVDYAADRGWEHVLVDLGWDADDVPDLVTYAHERGVGVFLWTHWTDLHRADERARRLDRWAAWGVDGVKVDFMDADDQGRLQFYDEVGAAAAERDLMVNFHGAVVPTGLSARWPHVMTYEGVMGAEHYPVKGLPPKHNVVLAFTRNVVGPMDYTPVTFSADNRATSDGHELALSVVFESGLQHFADSREAYAARPAAEWFLERVPAAWDETRVLGGWPGSEATVARRRDGDWFVGAITAGPARRLGLTLPVLDDEREATLVRDGPDGSSLVRESVVVGPDDALAVELAENGGCCLFAPE
ncbi:MAG: glycoside hydrolase family 97 catalytic domain-containing protein [Haloarculaceae archaeon]